MLSEGHPTWIALLLSWCLCPSSIAGVHVLIELISLTVYEMIKELDSFFAAMAPQDIAVNHHEPAWIRGAICQW